MAPLNISTGAGLVAALDHLPVEWHGSQPQLAAVTKALVKYIIEKANKRSTSLNPSLDAYAVEGGQAGRFAVVRT